MSNYLSKKEEEKQYYVDFGPEPVSEEVYKKAFEDTENDVLETTYVKKKNKVKKARKHIASTAFSILMAIILGALACECIGNYDGDNEMLNQLRNYGYTQTDDRFEILDEYDSIRIELDNTVVSITDYDFCENTEVSTDLLTKNGAVTCEVQEIGGKKVLVIKAEDQKNNKNLFDYFDDNYSPQRVAVFVPPAYADKIEVKTSNEYVSINAVTAKRVEVTNTGGYIYFDDCNIDKYICKSTGGCVSFTDTIINNKADIDIKNDTVHFYNVLMGDNAILSIDAKGYDSSLFLRFSNSMDEFTIDSKAPRTYISSYQNEHNDRFYSAGGSAKINLSSEHSVYLEFDTLPE